MLSQSEKKVLRSRMFAAYQPLADGLSALNCALDEPDLPESVDENLARHLRAGLMVALESTLSALDVCDGGQK